MLLQISFLIKKKLSSFHRMVAWTFETCLLLRVGWYRRCTGQGEVVGVFTVQLPKVVLGLDLGFGMIDFADVIN